MTDKQEENIRKIAKSELSAFEIYLDETTIRFRDWLDPDEILQIACTAYLSAGLTDINSSVEGLYGQIVIGE